jgi:hypothetical protein
MPHLVIIADPENAEPEVIYRERVQPAHVEDDHSAAQLIQRVGWAIADATGVEEVKALPGPEGVVRGEARPTAR